jgi:hypothetical protein
VASLTPLAKTAADSSCSNLRRQRMAPLEQRTVPAKVCKRCGLTKSASEFYRNKLMSDGLYSHCKVCNAHACPFLGAFVSCLALELQGNPGPLKEAAAFRPFESANSCMGAYIAFWPWLDTPPTEFCTGRHATAKPLRSAAPGACLQRPRSAAGATRPRARRTSTTPR